MDGEDTGGSELTRGRFGGQEEGEQDKQGSLRRLRGGWFGGQEDI